MWYIKMFIFYSCIDSDIVSLFAKLYALRECGVNKGSDSVSMHDNEYEKIR